MGQTNGAGYAIETRGLTKQYGEEAAVADLDLCVRRGEVYGFVGANGAGKTTTMRMLVGLVRPSRGGAWVLGHAAGAPASLARVGAMIEAPAFYPYLSGRDSLLVLARHAELPERRVDEVLGRVDLAARARDRFQTYSLGMKQRLGIAAALLKDPDLLILDEPTNGLDPEGIAGIRTLVRELGDGGRTVLLSSHLMSEVEQTCDRVGVVRGGRLVAEGTVEELRGAFELRIRAAPADRARALLEALACVSGVREVDGALLVGAAPERVPELNRRLAMSGIDVMELTPSRPSLEAVFMGLMRGGEAR